MHFYAAPYTLASRTETGGGLADEGEDIEVLELAFDQALEMVSNGQIADGKTILLLYWAAIHGPFAGSCGLIAPAGRPRAASLVVSRG